MPKIEFAWDRRKATSNRHKHGVSFEEASTVFNDPLAIFFAEWVHDEPRVVTIGSSTRGRTLFVVSVEFEGMEHLVRIISARKATRKERQRYEEGE